MIQAAVKALVEHAKDTDVRWSAVEALRALGEHVEEHIAAVAAQLEDEDVSVRIVALAALSELTNERGVTPGDS